MDPNSFNTAIFVGRPDQELPPTGFENVAKFYKTTPGKGLIIVVRSQKDAEEVMVGVTALKLPDGIKFKILVWEQDERLKDSLCQLLPELTFAKIFGKAWFECPEKHPTALRSGEPSEETKCCGTCGSTELTVIQANEEEVKQFCDVFASVVSLINFDTRSGITLHQMVNPTVNVLKNMPYLLPRLGKPSLETKDIFKSAVGKTAYCVAAGPSLEDAIPHLKRLQDTGLILCVGRLYKQLREEGIRVDYTVSCEMFDWDSAIFDDVGDVGDTVLCFPPVCAPSTVQKWPGRRYCMLDMRTAELLGREDYTLGGNSVAHHQMNFAAEILQADQIILVGQDLAYTKPDLNTHYGAQPKNWPDEVKDMDRELQKELYVECTGQPPYYPECHVQHCAAGTAVPVGPMLVRSSYAYRDFCTLFEILIQKHGKKIYNACPNGQKIKGTEYLNLAEWDGVRRQAPLVESVPSLG